MYPKGLYRRPRHGGGMKKERVDGDGGDFGGGASGYGGGMKKERVDGRGGGIGGSNSGSAWCGGGASGNGDVIKKEPGSGGGGIGGDGIKKERGSGGGGSVEDIEAADEAQALAMVMAVEELDLAEKAELQATRLKYSQLRVEIRQRGMRYGVVTLTEALDDTHVPSLPQKEQDAIDM
jgi:hypothetical protein